MTPSVPCPSARVLRSLRSREVTASTYRSQKRSQILLNRLRRRRRAPSLRKFASHAPNLRKQHECAVYVVSDLTTGDASPDYGEPGDYQSRDWDSNSLAWRRTISL